MMYLPAMLLGSLFPQQPVDLFVSRPGVETYRIPAICRTARGTLLAFAERRQSVHDQAANVIVLRRKPARAKEWSEVTVLADAQPASLNNPCVLATRSGVVWLMYQQYPAGVGEYTAKTGYDPATTSHAFVMSSRDDGRTWSAPREITRAVRREEARTVAGGPGVGIELTRGPHRGRLVFPFNEGIGRAWNVFAVYSDDGGNSWRRGEPAQKPEGTQPNEVQIAELADGHLLLNARNQASGHYRLDAVSQDGGGSWSMVQTRQDLPDPVCMGSLLRLSYDPDLLLFSNAASAVRRENGTLRSSSDGGRTWRTVAVVEPGSFQYSCLVALSPRRVGILYEVVEATQPAGALYRIRYRELEVGTLLAASALEVGTLLAASPATPGLLAGRSR